MANDPSDGLRRSQGKFADLKLRLKGATLAERVALESRLAKEMGLSLTPSQLVSIGTPTQGRTCVELESGPPSGSRQHGVAQSGSRFGGIDLSIGQSMVGTLNSMGLAKCMDVEEIRSTVRRLSEGGGVGQLGSEIQGLHEQLEMMAAAGSHPDLVAQGQEAISNLLFRKEYFASGAQGLGGRRNSQ